MAIIKNLLCPIHNEKIVERECETCPPPRPKDCPYKEILARKKNFKEKPKPRWGWEMVHSIAPEDKFPFRTFAVIQAERSQEIASKLGFPFNEKFSREAAEATERYISSLELIDNRPTRPEMRKALKILSESAAEFSKYLGKLDDLSRIELKLDWGFLEKVESNAVIIGGMAEAAISRFGPPMINPNLPSVENVKTVRIILPRNKKIKTKYDPKIGHTIFLKVEITRKDGSKEKHEMMEGDFRAWQKIRRQSPTKKGRPPKISLAFYLNDMVPIFEKWSGRKATLTKDPSTKFYGGLFFEFINEHLQRIGHPPHSNLSLGNQIERFLSRRKLARRQATQSLILKIPLQKS